MQSDIDNDDPIPLYTQAAIDYIETIIDKNMYIFEYGTGGSTYWWAKRVKRVVACEHSKRWYEKILLNEPPNVEVIHVELIYGGDYCRVAAQYPGEFDIIVIDGRDRVNCARHLLQGLKPHGMIIWDDSNRPSYQAGIEYLLTQGFKQRDFNGAGCALHPDSTWQTSVFFRD